ncbi:MAG: hypothetical protein L0Z50_13815 [Verrucomicrobiales bacterium]|nr:hypothetical protein [Verrucomicrobiales bacterium]
MTEIAHSLELSFSERSETEKDSEMSGSMLQETQAAYGQAIGKAPAFLVTPPIDDFQHRRQLDEAKSILEDQINQRGRAVICFVGALYSGRKQLARKLAWVSKAEFPHGALEIDLAEANIKKSPVKMALRAVIAHFGGVTGSDSLKDLRRTALELLTEKRVLLILHHLESSEQLENLLPPPQGSLFVTTCNIFKAPGMRSVEVPSSAPDAATALALEIGDRRLGFSEHAGRIAEACSHNLYAVRHAAYAIALGLAKPVEALVERFVRRPHHLEVIKSALEFRYSQLGPDERRAWRFLSVFRSQFTAGGARAILVDRSCDAQCADSLIERLAKRSLLQFTAQTDSFEIIALEREFLAEKLRTRKEYYEARRRHAKLNLNHAGKMSALFSGHPYVLTFLSDYETADFSAAFHWAGLNEPEACVSFLKDNVQFIKSLPAQLTITWGLRGRRAARKTGDRIGQALSNYFIGLGLVTLREEPDRILPYYRAAFESLKLADLRRRDLWQVTLIGGTLAEIYMEKEMPEEWQKAWDDVHALTKQITASEPDQPESAPPHS